MPRPDIDAAQAAAFLTERLGTAVAGVESVGAGAWSRAFEFTSDGGEWVVRFGEHRADFAKDRRAALFAGPDLPVPEFREIGEAFGGWYAISRRARGKPLETLDAASWRATLPSLLAALDAMRAVDTSDTSGYGGWDERGEARWPTWRDFVLGVVRDSPEQRTHGWRRRLREMSPRAAQVFELGLARLAELCEAGPVERHLIHGDLLNRNVLVDANRITAVFDWGCSLYGDFLYDVAWVEFWAPWHSGIAATDFRAAVGDHLAAGAVAVPDLAARMRCCLILIGLDHLAYNAWTGNHPELEATTARTLGVMGEVA